VTEGAGESGSRHRSFTYRTAATWTEARSGILTSDGKVPIPISNPPEFQGERGLWSPEEMFVASVEACHMATFLSFAARAGLPVLGYRSHSNGVLEFVDGDYRFTRVVIFPTVTVARGASEEEVLTLLREAEQHCLVANSIDSIVEVNPTIVHQ
jgi:organic hydroperoxide reductase OsmC/OhrA